MIKKFILPAMMASIVFPSGVIAAQNSFPELPSLESLYLGTNPILTPAEQHALKLSQQWQQSSRSKLRPVPGPNGEIKYLYGAMQPSIVCAALQVTDIALQPGEKVNSIHAGDSARWLIEPAVTGSGAGEIQHIIIKPTDAGLETSLIVATDRRTYHFQLKSHQTQYMARVSFIYPEELQARFTTVTQTQREEKQANTIPETGEYLKELDFNYTISGSASWKPLRVYNDGVKTIIQMPNTMKQMEAPTFLAIRDGEELMVNYRLQGDRYIIDALFDYGVLIAGVGSKQTKVEIKRGGI